jgi:hypothetical protein
MIPNNVPSFLSISKKSRGNPFQSRLFYTRLLFGGRQPLCGSAVTSSIETIRNPVCCNAEIADSRPDPGPFTLISTSRMPLRMAVLAQRCAACWAAKGVLLREPLKPTQPAEPQQIVSPFWSVIVISVLLKVALMYTIALLTFLLIFRLAPFAITNKTLY